MTLAPARVGYWPSTLSPNFPESEATGTKLSKQRRLNVHDLLDRRFNTPRRHFSDLLFKRRLQFIRRQFYSHT